MTFAVCLPLVMTSKLRPKNAPRTYTSERCSFGIYSSALHLEAFDCNIRSSIKVAICTVDYSKMLGTIPRQSESVVIAEN